MADPQQMIEALCAGGRRRMPTESRDLEIVAQFSEWLLEKPSDGEFGHHQQPLGFIGAFLVLEVLNHSSANVFTPNLLGAELAAYLCVQSHPFTRALLRIQWVDVCDESEWADPDYFDELGRSNERVLVDKVVEGAAALRPVLASPQLDLVRSAVLELLPSLVNRIDRICRTKRATCEDQRAFHEAVRPLADWIFENDERRQIHLSPALRSQTSNKNVAYLLKLDFPQFEMNSQFKHTFVDSVCLIGALKAVDGGSFKFLGSILSSLSGFSSKTMSLWFAGQAMKVAHDVKRIREFNKGLSKFKKESGIDRWHGNHSLTTEERNKLRTWQQTTGKTFAVCARIIRKLNRHDARDLQKQTIEGKYRQTPGMKQIWKDRRIADFSQMSPHVFAIAVWYRKYKDRALFERAPDEIFRRAEHARRDLNRRLKAKE